MHICGVRWSGKRFVDHNLALVGLDTVSSSPMPSYWREPMALNTTSASSVILPVAVFHVGFYAAAAGIEASTKGIVITSMPFFLYCFFQFFLKCLRPLPVQCGEETQHVTFRAQAVVENRQTQTPMAPFYYYQALGCVGATWLRVAYHFLAILLQVGSSRVRRR